MNIIETKKDFQRKIQFQHKDLESNKLLNLVASDFATSIFDLIGINYSVINNKGNYITQNKAMCSSITRGLTNAEEIDPYTWADCKKVMAKKEKVIKEEIFKEKYYLSIKQPLLNKGKCFGIVIISFDRTMMVPPEKMLVVAKDLFEGKILESASLQNTHDIYNLSKKELACIKQLMLGKTAKQIGKALGISPRTVEFHITNIKSKLRCYRKSEIIEFLIKNELQ